VGLIERIFGGKASEGSAAVDGYAPGRPEAIGRAWASLRVCPVCGEDFRGHAYALLATTALASRNRRRIDRFLKAVERRVPGELVAFCDWDAHGENAEAYALRCPDGNIAIAVVHTAVEPPHFKNVIRCDSLGVERSRQVKHIVPDERWATI
jgi:hypothetical protein